jgi:hypothetical protein
MKSPNFIVIGAPKSGTTLLYLYLQRHPGIFLPIRKELHYFFYELLRENANGPVYTYVFPSLCASREEYAFHYITVGHETAIGEVSPSYLYHYQVSERIKAELGDVKIIALLRNPIDEAFSQYMRLICEKRETLPFYKALVNEKKRKAAKWSDLWLYESSSLYTGGIEKYLIVFGHKNVQIVLFEDLFADPQTTMQKIFRSLGVDTTFVPDTSGGFNRTGLEDQNF